MDDPDNLEEGKDNQDYSIRELEERVKVLRLKLAFLKERLEAKKERAEFLLKDLKWMTIALWIMLMLLILSAYLAK